MKTPEIETVLQDPAASYWLKNALNSALQRDACDVVQDSAILAHLLQSRLERIKAVLHLKEVAP